MQLFYILEAKAQILDESFKIFLHLFYFWTFLFQIDPFQQYKDNSNTVFRV